MSLDSSASIRSGGVDVAGNPVTREVRPANRWRVIALACVGLLAGPFAILVLLGVPVAILAVGVWGDSAIIRVIGLIVLAIHALAAITLARVLRDEDPSSDGLTVTQVQAPELFRMIDNIRTRIDARKLDRVILTDQMNATVAQTPRFFGLAGHRHDLSLGLPLLQALSREECAAVVAHEIVHLRRADGKLNALVFRVRQLWSRLEAAAGAQTIAGCTVISKFAGWYRPKFEMVASDVLRANEFHADAVAAWVVSPVTVASALTRVAIAQAYLDELWSAFWLTNVRQAVPQTGPWAGFGDKLPCAGTWQEATSVLACAMNVEANALQSHPNLAERLDRIGASVSDMRFEGAIPLETNAARVLLGGFYRQVVEHFDRRWWASNRERWQSFYSHVGDQNARLDALDAAALTDGLSIETAIERAARAEYLRDAKAAVDRYKWCLARYPHEAAGYYSLGKFLLEQGDENGIRHLIHAMSLDETAIPDAAARIIGHLEGRGEQRRARIYRRKVEVWSEGQTDAPSPLEQFAVRGRLSSVVQKPDARARLNVALQNVGGVVSAWFVQTPLQPWSVAPRAHLVIEHGTGKPVAWSGRTWRSLCSDLSQVTDAEFVELASLSPEAQHAIRHVDGALVTSKNVGAKRESKARLQSQT